MVPKIGEELGIGGAFECPHCGSDYLHHERVEIFERSQDAEKGLHLDVEGQFISINQNLSNNPSLRRNGIRIFFSCEGCEAIVQLTIVQHKGQTFLATEYEVPALVLVAVR